MIDREQPDAPATTGRVLHRAWAYDLLAKVFMRGREAAFRDRVLELAAIGAGQAVLDVGCGTGTLAIRAARRVGPTGEVHGIDASPEMIARARKKAARAGVAVAFATAAVEALPFADVRFDAVLATLMLHHLPRPGREQFAREVRRVVKPGGRVVVVDFAKPSHPRRGLLAHFHRHGGLQRDEIIRILTGAGWTLADSGAVGFADLSYVVATP